MHYSLEILEAIMINQQGDNMVQWVSKFINLGGIEEL